MFADVANRCYGFHCSHEIEMKYQEIMKASGILTLDGEVGDRAFL